ncbi:hypothetical protein D3C73_1545440 [compost metagenome]
MGSVDFNDIKTGLFGAAGSFAEAFDNPTNILGIRGFRRFLLRERYGGRGDDRLFELSFPSGMS